MLLSRILALASILLPLAFAAEAYSIKARITPQSVEPGDAFMLKITGAEAEPSARINGKPVPLSSCGKGCWLGIGGVHRDEPPGKKTVEFGASGDSGFAHFEVKRKKFETRHIEVDMDKVRLNPEEEARADAEAETLKELWGISSPRAWEGKFSPPVGDGVSLPFGILRIFNDEKESIHTGLDYRSDEGTPVKAINRGRVVIARNFFFGGNTIVINHGDGIYSVYMHLSYFKAKEGEDAARGETIALSGMTGRVSGAHLHFGINVRGVSVNPLSVFRLAL